MNVIVSNRQKEIIDNANIDAIKDLNGLFNVDDLINKFKNYFFSKMILDATSVVNFASKPVLTTLANEIGAEKLIILLPSNPEPPMEFKKLLLELKIYNFTNKIEDVVRFIENPNTYEDAVKTIDGSFNNQMYVDNSIKENDNSENNVDSNTSNDNNISMGNGHSSLGDMLSNFNVHNNNDEGNNAETTNEENNDQPVDNSNENSDNENINYDLSNGFNNFVNNEDNNSNESSLNYEIEKDDGNDTTNNNESGQNTFLITDGFDDMQFNNQPKNDKKIIGFKNITLHAGSTSLIYMLHRVIVNTLKKDVLSIEVGKNDFRLFRERNMISVDSNELENTINNANVDIIFVDLNDLENFEFCTDVLYLIEPSTIMLNRLMATDKEIFKELKGKKVILNKSLLSPNDIRTLSSEAGIEFFDSIKPLNDRILNDSISKLLDLLGIK